MRRARSSWLLGCLAVAACAASEGGVTGTGLSSISGNVAAVRELTQEGTSPVLPFPIRIRIAEFPLLEATTDAEGTFRLDGEFSGAVTLQFANAADGAEIGPLALEVPSGSETVLENIEIRTAAPPADRVQPGAVLQFDVFGHADMVECAADDRGFLLLTDNGQPSRQFMVALTAETEIERRDGGPLTCPEIRPGAPLRIEGFLRLGDRTILARQVVVSALRPRRPQPMPRPERLRGVVHAVTCERGLIQVEQGTMDPVRRTVQFSEQTDFQCQPDAEPPCDCTAITIGSRIAVIGTIFPARPGQVQADIVYLHVSSVAVDLTGPITRLACEAGGLAIRDDTAQRAVPVALTRDTEIRCRGGRVCPCGDLRLRQRVRVEGRQPPAGGTVTATAIAVLERLPRISRISGITRIRTMNPKL